MSVWEKYSKEQRANYIQFLQVYGALSNLFRQKHGDLIPYLDSKFQETIFAKIFNSRNVDIGNTPHDVLSVFGSDRVGIGIKTWMGSKPSFQKVMQIKRHQSIISKEKDKNDPEAVAIMISNLKNEKMISDYKRLGLCENNNIYHYVTRDEGKFVVNECSYPLIDINKLKNIYYNNNCTSLIWTDGIKDYKFTFADCQIWQKFDSSKKDATLLQKFNVNIIDDPFDFLLRAYLQLSDTNEEVQLDFVEAYLPLYSYRTNKVEEKSGLNAWNAAPKNKESLTLRPLNEIYIPIPKKFHEKYPRFFINNQDILDFWAERKSCETLQEIRFHLILPNGKRIPALLTGDYMKNFQSGSKTEYDENGKRFGQDALGQWLLVDVLGLNERVLVTREWLEMKGTDSVRIWRKRDDYSNIYIDFAPVGSFAAFINEEPVPEEDEFLEKSTIKK